MKPYPRDEAARIVNCLLRTWSGRWIGKEKADLFPPSDVRTVLEYADQSRALLKECANMLAAFSDQLTGDDEWEGEDKCEAEALIARIGEAIGEQ